MVNNKNWLQDIKDYPPPSFNCSRKADLSPSEPRYPGSSTQSTRTFISALDRRGPLPMTSVLLLPGTPLSGQLLRCKQGNNQLPGKPERTAGSPGSSVLYEDDVHGEGSFCIQIWNWVIWEWYLFTLCLNKPTKKRYSQRSVSGKERQFAVIFAVLRDIFESMN